MPTGTAASFIVDGSGTHKEAIAKLTEAFTQTETAGPPSLLVVLVVEGFGRMIRGPRAAVYPTVQRGERNQAIPNQTAAG